MNVDGLNRHSMMAPGVRWVRMPLPYALNYINPPLPDDSQGWALVDTGVRTDEAA